MVHTYINTSINCTIECPAPLNRRARPRRRQHRQLLPPAGFCPWSLPLWSLARVLLAREAGPCRPSLPSPRPPGLWLACWCLHRPRRPCPSPVPTVVPPGQTTAVAVTAPRAAIQAPELAAAREAHRSCSHGTLPLATRCATTELSAMCPCASRHASATAMGSQPTGAVAGTVSVAVAAPLAAAAAPAVPESASPGPAAPMATAPTSTQGAE